MVSNKHLKRWVAWVEYSWGTTTMADREKTFTTAEKENIEARLADPSSGLYKMYASKKVTWTQV